MRGTAHVFGSSTPDSGRMLNYDLAKAMQSDRIAHAAQARMIKGLPVESARVRQRLFKWLRSLRFETLQEVRNRPRITADRAL